MSRALVGTSGWSYPSWRPAFYPADLDPAGFLAFYATRLTTVELNSTGYRLPSVEQFRRWAALVPVGFTFAVKAPPGALRRLDALQDAVRALGDRLGCVRLVVESPRDDGLVELLLGSSDPAIRWALDLRDPSWDGIEERLVAEGAIRVGDLETPSTWRYLRFRKTSYDEERLVATAQRLVPHLARGEQLFAYFRHGETPTAPRAAARLFALLEQQ